MSESNLMHGWAVILGSLATIASVLIAFEIMLGMGKPSDAVKHIGAVFGIIVVLMLAPGIIVSAWLTIPLWQRIALIAIGICIWQWLRAGRRSPRKDRP